MIKHCVEQAVAYAKSIEQVIENQVLTTIFDELTKHQTARNFIRYLLSDLFKTKFDVTTIAEKPVEDSVTAEERRNTIKAMKEMIDANNSVQENPLNAAR